MRSLAILLFACILGGCSGMLLGGGTSGSSSPAGGSTSSQQHATTDAAISSRVRQQFASDASLKDHSLSVSTRNGLVSIGGSLPSYGARERAEKLAMSTDGVTGVDNRISVNHPN